MKYAIPSVCNFANALKAYILDIVRSRDYILAI